MKIYQITPNIGPYTYGTPIYTLAPNGPAALAQVMATRPMVLTGGGNYRAMSGAVAWVTHIPAGSTTI